jgi:tetratricopeptide (TPR) repeat protein
LAFASLAGLVAVLAAVLGIGWLRKRPERHLERALAALDSRRFDVVEQELAALEGDSAYEPHRHFLRGALMLWKGRHYAALDEFGSCVAHPELRVRTLTLSGQALYRARRLRDAVGLLAQAVEADPDAVEAHRCLAAAYDDLGLLSPSMAEWSRVAELDPADPRPHRLMGLRCKDFERWDAAVKMYRESLRRDANQPDRGQILLEMAECQMRLQHVDDALGTLAQCPASPARWTKEAECHYSAGRADEARRLVEEALRQSPADLSALLLAGNLALQDGNAAAAADAYLRATIAYPKDHVAHYKLSQAYRRLGKDAQAKHHADLSDRLRQLRLEFSQLHATAAAEPDNANVRCRIGVLARQLDRSDLARVWFEAALAIDPRHQDALRNLRGDVPPTPQP